jgi:hypothetical protein
MGKRRQDGPLLDRFDGLNVWSHGEERAPHKPLLVLYALGRWSRGETADVPFRDADRDLTALLKEFGPPRQSYHPSARSSVSFTRQTRRRWWACGRAGLCTSRRGGWRSSGRPPAFSAGGRSR